MANGTFFSSLVRLYHATFDRSSDKGGVGYWASKLAKGEMTFAEVAASFMESDEFKEKYGDNLSNEDFIRLLYENVLNREPDEEGLAYWLKVMEEGSLRHEVLVGFSESDEHVEQIETEYGDELTEAESIEDSLEETEEEDSEEPEDEPTEDDSDSSDEEEESPEEEEEDATDEPEDELEDDTDDDSTDELGSDVDSDQDGLTDEQELTLLYNALFNRDPDQQGLGYWMGELASSKVAFDDIIELFMESDEFTELYGDNLSDSDFIEALYNNSLGRASDAQGKGFWISQLASGKARAEILEAFAESDEHVEIVLSGDVSNTGTVDEVLV